jgi:hypothetical protein
MQKFISVHHFAEETEYDKDNKRKIVLKNKDHRSSLEVNTRYPDALGIVGGLSHNTFIKLDRANMQALHDWTAERLKQMQD